MIETSGAPFLIHSLPLHCKIKHIPLKRIFDILFSGVFIIICAPILLLITLLISLTSPGKPIYSHERVGRGGKTFRCYKFRTMFTDADQLLQKILRENPDLKREWEANYKLKNDPRITRLGQFLRKTSMDELPQFWNVLKGDLSIVGPRPVVQEEIAKYYQIKAHKILSIRPGITGLWQISGRSDICNYAKRVELDECYVDNQSFLLDLKLVLKTVPALIQSRGAY